MSKKAETKMNMLIKFVVIMLSMVGIFVGGLYFPLYVIGIISIIGLSIIVLAIAHAWEISNMSIDTNPDPVVISSNTHYVTVINNKKKKKANK